MELILFIVWVVVAVFLGFGGFAIKDPSTDDAVVIFGSVLWPFALLGIILGVIIALIAEHVFGKEYPKYK